MIYFLTTIFITSTDISTLKTKQLWTLVKTSVELLPLSHNTLTSTLFYFRVNCFWAGDLRYIENNQFWRNRCEIPPGQYKTRSILFTYCWYIIEPTDFRRCSFDYTWYFHQLIYIIVISSVRYMFSLLSQELKLNLAFLIANLSVRPSVRLKHFTCSTSTVILAFSAIKVRLN